MQFLQSAAKQQCWGVSTCSNENFPCMLCCAFGCIHPYISVQAIACDMRACICLARWVLAGFFFITIISLIIMNSRNSLRKYLLGFGAKWTFVQFCNCMKILDSKLFQCQNGNLGNCLNIKHFYSVKQVLKKSPRQKHNSQYMYSFGFEP